MIKTTGLTPYALAALRVMAALLFMEHALQKFFQFPGPVPGLPLQLPTLLAVAGSIEIITGLMVLVGLKTRLAAFVASGLMACAYFITHAPNSFWPALNGGEPAILYCFLFLFLATAGGGAVAMDNLGQGETSARSAV